jgi:hypothetical protein
MRAKELRKRIPLFPVIPIVPMALMIGSFVLSLLAFREARHARTAAA